MLKLHIECVVKLNLNVVHSNRKTILISLAYCMSFLYTNCHTLTFITTDKIRVLGKKIETLKYVLHVTIMQFSGSLLQILPYYRKLSLYVSAVLTLPLYKQPTSDKK